MGTNKPYVGLALLALGALALTAVSGLVGALTYTDMEPQIRAAGLTLQHLRPIHTSGAFAWVFLGGVTIAHLFLRDCGADRVPGFRLRLVLQNALWGLAGIGIVVSVLAGQFSGREYAGYHPIFSALILLGWLLFAWNYFRTVGWSLRGKPVYVYMWSVAVPLFAVTYTEGHLYLIEAISSRPLRDLAIQWKSNGTLVGSFNLMAYGSLAYAGCKMSGDATYARSRLCFSLFFVGLLNTFTNYGHHTFHLPQTPLIHWISFLISMLEVVILAKVAWDVVGLLRRSGSGGGHPVAQRFAGSVTLWTFLLLVIALVISIPPLNSLIHGTPVIVAHSMGSMLGIDSMILWTAFAYLMHRMLRSDHPVLTKPAILRVIPVINVTLFLFLSTFLARGAIESQKRYLGPSAPDLSHLVDIFPVAMVLTGTVLAGCILWLTTVWGLALLRRSGA